MYLFSSNEIFRMTKHVLFKIDNKRFYKMMTRGPVRNIFLA